MSNDNVSAIRFADDLVDAVLEGEKTITVRVGEEWAGLEPGVRVQLLDEDGECFARATVGGVGEGPAAATYRTVNAMDGYRSFRTQGAFLDTLRQYYPDRDIMPSTTVYEIHLRDLAPVQDYVAARERAHAPRRRPDR